MAQPDPSLLQRLWIAFVCFWQVLLKPDFARAILPAYEALAEGRALPSGEARPEQPVKPAEAPPHERHASGLLMLAMLQREGRLIDFLQEDVASFPDADVGTAARVVHEGCRKVLRQYLTLAPVMPEGEGARVTIPAGFDANRIRLTGNVTGSPPFQGTLKHHGWVAAEVRLPTVSEGLDPRVVQAAEVEL